MKRKPILFQINTACNSGSTGKIAEGIGIVAIKKGWESYIAYARNFNKSESHALKIASAPEIYSNVLFARIFDQDNPLAKIATKRLIRHIEEISPDILHFHNLHGYYLNVPYFFDFIAELKKPVVWTLHDCWAFTGHCGYFFNCQKWKTFCEKCPQKKEYPKSLIFDNSKKNFDQKRNFADKAKDVLHMVPVSDWLDKLAGQSIYKDCSRLVIKNGIDTYIFCPASEHEIMAAKEKYCISKDYIIAVANIWTPRKGYGDLYKIKEILRDEIDIVVVGTNEEQNKDLRKAGIIAINRTENQMQLSVLYSGAKALINPTYQDNYPTVNIESMACGTPVITYNTGGSPESIDSATGFVVDQGDFKSMADIALKIKKEDFVQNCRAKAEKHFDKNNAFEKYINLYNDILNK